MRKRISLFILIRSYSTLSSLALSCVVCFVLFCLFSHMCIQCYMITVPKLYRIELYSIDYIHGVMSAVLYGAIVDCSIPYFYLSHPYTNKYQIPSALLNSLLSFMACCCGKHTLTFSEMAVFLLGSVAYCSYKIVIIM